MELHAGDARAVLAALPASSVQVVVTSVPYWRMRDWQGAGAIGMEDGVDVYVRALACVMGQVRRVLRPDGVAWVNIADVSSMRAQKARRAPGRGHGDARIPPRPSTTGIARAKSLLAIPQRFELELIEAGWILRSEVTWHKPNAVPETVEDRPRRVSERILMLTRSAAYRCERADTDVWEIPTAKSPVGGEAAFPLALAVRCLQGCVREGDLVLDPFCGSATVGVAALGRGCRFVGVDTDEAALDGARRRLSGAGAAAGGQW